MWLIYLISILIEIKHCKTLEEIKVILPMEGISLKLMPGYRVNEPWLGSTLELSHSSKRVVIPHLVPLCWCVCSSEKISAFYFLEKDWKFLMSLS